MEEKRKRKRRDFRVAKRERLEILDGTLEIPKSILSATEERFSEIHSHVLSNPCGKIEIQRDCVYSERDTLPEFYPHLCFLIPRHIALRVKGVFVLFFLFIA